MTDSGWVTMQDVAREAGVSTMTVSRALRTPDKVSAATRARIDAAVRKLGYVPDQAAGALSSGASRLVAALLSTLASSIFATTVAGLSGTLGKAGYQLLLGTTDYSPRNEEALLRATLGRRPDGIVLTSGVHTRAARQMLERADVPVVELWELPERPVDMAVGFSNRDAGRCMTRFLAEIGYRRIATLGPHTGHDLRGRQRQAGYAEMLAELGLGPPRVGDAAGSSDSIEIGARGLVRILEAWPDTDAIFCTSDAVALGALAEARRRGLAVPGDIAIAGLGDFDYAGPAGLELTTLRVHGEAMGEAAGRLLLRRLEGHTAGPRVIDVGFEPVRRATA